MKTKKINYSKSYHQDGLRLCYCILYKSIYPLNDINMAI